MKKTIIAGFLVLSLVVLSGAFGFIRPGCVTINGVTMCQGAL